jgi:CRISPR-associated exonuclease Cas4
VSYLTESRIQPLPETYHFRGAVFGSNREKQPERDAIRRLKSRGITQQLKRGNPPVELNSLVWLISQWNNEVKKMAVIEDGIRDIVNGDASDIYERDPETFFGSQIGFCSRQLYLQKLGLTDTKSRYGKFQITRLIQEYLEESLTEKVDRLESSVSVCVAEDGIKFIGRCNLYDPVNDIVHMLKTRNGWYKFTPPNERHIDQLHIYMRGTGASRGNIIYISKNDLKEIRRWPDEGADSEYVQFDEARYTSLVSKAQRIRDVIWSEGIASVESEIPFEKCDCYFCEEESLDIPAEHNKTKSDTNSQTNERQQPKSVEVDGGAVVTTRDSADCGRQFKSDGRHIPADLRDRDIWVVWDCQSKIPLAPWESKTMYPVQWASDGETDPRRPYKKAKMVAELPVEEIHRVWPFPDGSDLPERVKPTILLPHEPGDSGIVFVDFDDVRNPETGNVTAEVATLTDELGGYTEVSRSGTGLHIFVKGSLPDAHGSFIANLDTGGSVEMYDHSRFVGCTWNTVADFPSETVPPAQSTIANIIAQYSE